MAPARQLAATQAIPLHDRAESQQVSPGEISAALEPIQLQVLPTMSAFVLPSPLAPHNLPAPAMTHLFGGNIGAELKPISEKQISPPSENISDEENTENLSLLAEVSSLMLYAEDAGRSTAQ